LLIWRWIAFSMSAPNMGQYALILREYRWYRGQINPVPLSVVHPNTFKLIKRGIVLNRFRDRLNVL